MSHGRISICNLLWQNSVKTDSERDDDSPDDFDTTVSVNSSGNLFMIRLSALPCISKLSSCFICRAVTFSLV
jgi:hypothetical protein